MPLDSDDHHADAQLSVHFYKSSAKGYEGKDFVKIMVPGNVLNIVDQPVRESHKSRFPRQYLHFQMQNNATAVVGTPLEEWQKACPEDLSEMQMNELQILKFQTVEQIATASDGQLQRMPMGALGLRNLARAFLRKNKIEGEEHIGTELAETKKALLVQQEQMAQLQAQIAELMAGKRGPGRPPKQSVEVSAEA